MSASETALAETPPRREDFLFDSFRYLEAKLQRLRRIVMREAAAIAERQDVSSEIYRVEKGHVDQALAVYMSEEAHRLLGLND